MNEELKVIISAEIDDLKKGVAEAKGEIDSLTSEAPSKFDKFQSAIGKAGEVSSQVLKTTATAVVGVGGALMALVPATEEYRNAQAKLNTAFESAGSSTEQAKNTYNDLYRVLGDGDVAVEAAGHLAKLTTNEKDLAEWTDICQGVYATFGDSLPIESLTEAANETAKTGSLTGALADALNWAGESEEAFQEKLDACNTEAEREALIRETLNGVYQEAAATYEQNAADILAQNEAQAKMAESTALIGEALTPVMTMLTELGAEILADLAPYIQEFAEENLPEIKEALDGVGEKIGEVISFIADNWQIIATIGGIILGIAAAIVVLNAGLTAYNTVMAITAAVSLPMIGTIALIVAGIAALIAVIVLCVKHWDEIKEAASKAIDSIKKKADEMKKAVAEKFEEMKKAMSEKVEAAKKAVNDKFEEIKKSVGDKIESAKQTVSTKFEEMKNVASEKVEALKAAASQKFEEMKTAIGLKVDAAKAVVSEKFELIKSTISEKISGAKEKALGIFDEIKDGITKKIEGARDAVKTAIDKMKGFFNFKWELPKIKLPHFSISGKFSLNPPRVPKFSIKWYQKGGIFDKPTLFGYGNGMMGGLGENGAEAIVPLEKNTKWMNILADKLAERQGSVPIVLQVDGKTFAQTSINSINDLTRQTGKLALNLV